MNYLIKPTKSNDYVMVVSRLNKTSGETCEVKQGFVVSCEFKELQFLLLTPGIKRGMENINYTDFIKNSFSNSNSKWRIC